MSGTRRCTGENLTYSMLTLVEETLEMSGIVMFLYTLLTYLETHLPKFGVCLERTEPLDQVTSETHPCEGVHEVGVWI